VKRKPRGGSGTGHDPVAQDDVGCLPFYRDPIFKTLRHL
jgi:hypothetical protein